MHMRNRFAGKRLLTRRVSCLQAAPEANRASGEEGLHATGLPAVDPGGERAPCAWKCDSCLCPTPHPHADTSPDNVAEATSPAAAPGSRSGHAVDFRQRSRGVVRHRRHRRGPADRLRTRRGPDFLGPRRHGDDREPGGPGLARPPSRGRPRRHPGRLPRGGPDQPQRLQRPQLRGRVPRLVPHAQSSARPERAVLPLQVVGRRALQGHHEVRRPGQLPRRRKRRRLLGVPHRDRSPAHRLRHSRQVRRRAVAAQQQRGYHIA